MTDIVEMLRQGERDGVDGWWLTMQCAADEIERIQCAIRHYAEHAPIDLKSAREIQGDLLAIAGDRHVHVNSISDERCLLCGHNFRHEIHLRVGEAP